MNKPVIEIIEQGKDYKIYYMHQDLSGLDLYERTKAIERFINNATKTLETLISTDLRHFLRGYGIIPYDGSEKSLETAISKLNDLGKEIYIIDRYYEIENEKTIAISQNNMTVIFEDDNLIGCSIEFGITEREEK